MADVLSREYDLNPLHDDIYWGYIHRSSLASASCISTTAALVQIVLLTRPIIVDKTVDC